MRAFERECDGRLEHLVALAGSSRNLKHRYLGENVQWDSRVPKDRQATLETDLHREDPLKCSSLPDALTSYKRKRIENDEPETFSRDFNGINEILPASYSNWHRPPERLATVVNLSWHLNEFSWAVNRYELFRDFQPQPGNQAAWFESKFVNESEANQNEFLEQAFDAIFEYRKAKGKKPVWVGEWDRISPILPLHPDNWLRYVGCEAPPYRQLAIVLQYGQKDGMPPLFRPTQLESGGNHLHFPLPGETESAIGGFCVNLMAVAQAERPYNCSREWIHCPFRWKPEFFDAAGRTLGWAGSNEPLPDTDLGTRRQIHRDYVTAKLPIRRQWMQ